MNSDTQILFLIKGEDINAIDSELAKVARARWTRTFTDTYRLNQCEQIFKPIFGVNWPAAILRHREAIRTADGIYWESMQVFISDQYVSTAAIDPDRAVNDCLIYLNRWLSHN